jgi:dolichyl-phosphate beta-glucosyltransferase
MDISIVIPFYNEAFKISRDISAASDFISKHFSNGEVVVVDDGSTDQGAKEARETPVKPGISLNVLSYQPNKGKGYAVRKGILAARGEIILFIDSGLCIPYSNLTEGIQFIKNDVSDIAHGSRLLPESLIARPRKWHRKLTSYLFRKFIHLYFSFDLTDTQCGLKIYKKEVGHFLYRHATINGFMFDIEIILLGRRNGYRITEFPVEWFSDTDSRLSFWPAFIQVLSDLYRLKKKDGD